MAGERGDKIDRQWPFLRDWLRVLAEDGPVPGINWQMVGAWALTALAPAPPQAEPAPGCESCGGDGRCRAHPNCDEACMDCAGRAGEGTT